MIQRLIIGIVLLSAASVSAQTIAKNEVGTHETRPNVPVAVVSGALINPGYSVICLQNNNSFSFEITSPKSDKGEVKLQNVNGDDICVIHKGAIKEGKNTFSLGQRKIARGIYYVVSKLSNGEQFADRVVISK